MRRFIALVMLLMVFAIQFAPVNVALAVSATGQTPTNTYHDNNPGTIVGRACEYTNSTAAGCNSNQSLDGSGAHKTSYIKTIVDTFLFAAGIVSFIFVIIGGIRYITSTGNSSRTQQAKETLLYAIIGLIVTFLAVPITSFIIARLN